MNSKWFKNKAVRVIKSDSIFNFTETDASSVITTSKTGNQKMEMTMTDTPQDVNMSSTEKVDPISEKMTERILKNGPFWYTVLETLQDVVLTLLSKLNSWTLGIWFLIFYARIHYGESWNDIMIYVTMTVLGRRVASDYLNKKYPKASDSDNEA